MEPGRGGTRSPRGERVGGAGGWLVGGAVVVGMGGVAPPAWESLSIAMQSRVGVCGNHAPFPTFQAESALIPASCGGVSDSETVDSASLTARGGAQAWVVTLE